MPRALLLGHANLVSAAGRPATVWLALHRCAAPFLLLRTKLQLPADFWPPQSPPHNLIIPHALLPTTLTRRPNKSAWALVLLMMLLGVGFWIPGGVLWGLRTTGWDLGAPQAEEQESSSMRLHASARTHCPSHAACEHRWQPLKLFSALHLCFVPTLVPGMMTTRRCLSTYYDCDGPVVGESDGSR